MLPSGKRPSQQPRALESGLWQRERGHLSWPSYITRHRIAFLEVPVQERRSTTRACVNTLVNKYIDGFPYACEALDLSEGGMLVRRIFEPERTRDFYPIELSLPNMDEGMWIWTRTAWKSGDSQALRFVWMDDSDREVLSRYLASVRNAA